MFCIGLSLGIIDGACSSSCRKAVMDDSEKLKMLQVHVQERKTRLRDSAQKVAKLKQQLKAANDIFNANNEQLEELNAKVSTRVLCFF